jgi:serine/threonine protein kinase
MPDSPRLLVETGRLLRNRYRLTKRLASGGMGEIFVADDLESGQRVAVKSLLSEVGDKTRDLFQRRFREEADILRRLHAPGVPSFVDAFDEDDRSFLIMQYIDGFSLEQLREQTQGGMPADFVVSVAIQVCRILHHLHTQVPPLIHRDIKPSNIIVCNEDNEVFLVDFGLAREFSGENNAKTLVGTVGYCPLEQFQGRPEPRSDVYALGATVVELLTGVAPQPLNIPPLASVCPELPAQLCSAVDRAVQNEIEDRHADAHAFESELQRAASALAGTEPSVDVSPANRIEELVRLWGAGKPRELTPLEMPEPLPPIVIPLPEVKPGPLKLLPPAAAPRRRWALPLGLVAVLLLGVLATQYWSRHRYNRAQMTLVADTFPDGGPGQGWQLRDASGLFPAEDLGVGDPNREWGSSPRSGLVFTAPEPQTVKFMHCQLRRLKGAPKMLLFCEPWGVVLEPVGQDDYQLRVVTVGAVRNLNKFQLDSNVQTEPLALGPFRKLNLSVSVDGHEMRVFVDHRAVVSQAVSAPWTSASCGVVMLNSVRSNRCVLSNWQIL